MGAFMKTCTILLAAACILLLAIPAADSSLPQKLSSSFQAHYTLFDKTFTVSIQPSLYAYYNNLSHTIPRDSGYAKFITPKAIQPIADTIQTLTQNMSNPREQFANTVLSFVHQIPYNITGAKFPVETLIDNQGDCGAVSLLAASIMKAGGLDVVLIKYTAPDFAHMNVGVNLPHTPAHSTLFFATTSYQYNNRTYWTAEATPKADWKVGDQPSQMANMIATIIPIDEYEQTSPGQVSCSLSALAPSTLTLDVLSKPPNAEMNRSLLISGTTVPAAPDSPITIYINKNGSCTNYVKTQTDSNGSYAFLWNVTSDGTYYISASCNGNATYAGADSEPAAVFIGPKALLQFQTDAYNYIVGRAIGDIAIRPYIGIEDFLNTPVGTNVSFSYSFSVLSTGQSMPEVETINVTIPARQYTIRDRHGQEHTVQVPAQTRTVPQNIPRGLEPLSLPDDFNQTINSQFCFVVQKTLDGNYTLNIQGLNDNDINSIKENSDAVFFNATQNIAQSTWYRVTTAISEHGITAGIEKEDGELVQNLQTQNSIEASPQLILLVANNVDSAVVLKNFQVNDGTTPAEPTPQIVHQPPPQVKSLLPFAIIVLVIAVTLIVTGIIINLKRKHQGKHEP
jgi:hypothetical protein